MTGIVHTLNLLCPGAPVELRVLTDRMITRRFISHNDAADWARSFPLAKSVYVVLNPFDEAKIQGVAVDDASITRRHWLLIDVDPTRPKETNATDIELGHALAVADRTQKFLTSHGWPLPVEALSGNGGHLLYRIDLPNDETAHQLIEALLKYLSAAFDTEHAHIDTAVANASRITKLYGTPARKGPDIPDRPVRLSSIITEPAVLSIVPFTSILKLLDATKKKPSKPKKAPKAPIYDWSQVLARVEVVKTWTKADVTYYQIRCPWTAEHSDTAVTGTILTVSTAGAVGFKCQHEHCKDRGWKTLRDHLGIRTETQAKVNTEGAVLIAGGRLTEIVNQAETALLNRSIYQRGGQLTRAIRLDAAMHDIKEVRRDAGSMMLIAVKEPWLIEQMGQSLTWLKYERNGDEWSPTDPPSLYARTLIGRAEWKFPVLRGVLTAPTLTMQGRIIQTPGFDASSGLLIDIPNDYFPPVPESPTREDAYLALGRLAEPLRSFPFVDDAARAVALAAMLTALVRLSLRTAPLHSFDAPTAGTGKSLLAEMAGLLATGSRPPAMSQGKTDEEDEKRLSTVLFAGDPVIHIDNCERPISGDFLCSMLTQEIVQARILGLSERRILPSTALVLASGNNLIFAGDTSRRAVICRLDAGVERPDTREFDFDCHAEVLVNRAQMVVDGLTVLRAYHYAGRPVSLTPMGSFTDYEWIRGSLVWLECADPADTRLSILANDPRKDELIVVIDLWEQAFGPASVDVAEIDTRATTGGHDPITNLREKLIEVCCRAGKWSSKSIGWWLRRNKDRVVGGKCIKCYPEDRVHRWGLAGEVRSASTVAANEEQSAQYRM